MGEGFVRVFSTPFSSFVLRLKKLKSVQNTLGQTLMLDVYCHMQHITHGFFQGKQVKM